MDIEQLRLAVAKQQAVVEKLQAELNQADQKLIELEKQLETAEEKTQWFNLFSALRHRRDTNDDT